MSGPAGRTGHLSGGASLTMQLFLEQYSFKHSRCVTVTQSVCDRGPRYCILSLYMDEPAPLQMITRRKQRDLFSIVVSSQSFCQELSLKCYFSLFHINHCSYTVYCLSLLYKLNTYSINNDNNNNNKTEERFLILTISFKKVFLYLHFCAKNLPYQYLVLGVINNPCKGTLYVFGIPLLSPHLLL